jgi:hypothetical protein
METSKTALLACAVSCSLMEWERLLAESVEVTTIVWIPAGVPLFLGLGFCFAGDALQPESEIKPAASRTNSIVRLS